MYANNNKVSTDTRIEILYRISVIVFMTRHRMNKYKIKYAIEDHPGSNISKCLVKAISSCGKQSLDFRNIQSFVI